MHSISWVLPQSSWPVPSSHGYETELRNSFHCYHPSAIQHFPSVVFIGSHWPPRSLTISHHFKPCQPDNQTWCLWTDCKIRIISRKPDPISGTLITIWCAFKHLVRRPDNPFVDIRIAFWSCYQLAVACARRPFLGKHSSVHFLSLYCSTRKPIPPWQPELAIDDKMVSNLAADRWDYLPSEQNYRWAQPHPALAVTTSHARILYSECRT